ncbi:30S ribosomal protein S11 [Candidatus Giovannonibacteria bacterium RIFCSPHIGHO2_01_FULL_45_33]|uniref:Small ribosomal subunit protein uS11 n=1 Tax=Candidatus Giovannonibacteria bacterium RIFCSPLOWO2_01_FULL_45_34 TaxID=1798351 RepID=A0A1F5WYN5_9BACT|nr:MAG: 30S ribosomal protein S11 [Candidatus Giovannonibacteria bacterium RIFCSPHIGHO2_01_FULL_45_33]OGF70900.1 MAG: 30S ribosomal protein S11 [Candidatus Giovannonibacteria bacterium RIFCSPHIGHO2_02_FULL_44_11]OGF80748.1 MAG: 30S ribosomal protein S11 [Candidatus Giovannonibacteria bacterium RIFCSPLOWO2_01_FULL_45_34]
MKTTSSKRKFSDGVVHVQATYNNTIITITDRNGDVVMSSSAGALGFSGAKKGTPYASTKVAEFLGEKAKAMGIKELSILIKGVGAGRDAAARSFAGQGFEITSIRDITPIPHNGPRSPKPRRV